MLFPAKPTEQASFYQALLDIGDHGVIVIDQENAIRFWNNWMLQASGLTADQVTGRTLSDVFPEICHGRLYGAVRDCLQFGMPAMLSPSLNQAMLPLKPLPQFSSTFPHMQQSVRINPIEAPDGGFLCALSVRDVTLSAQRDRLLRRQASEMAELANLTQRSEDRTRAILQNTIDAIVLASDDGTIEPLNARAELLCGAHGDPELGNIIRFLLPDRGDHAPRQPASDRILTDLGTGVIEILARLADGQEIPLEVAISHFADDARHHYIITLRDISQRKRHETEIRRTMRELERSNTELEQFAYAASHDLQEPLRMVSSYVQLLARRYQNKIDETADEFIRYAVDGTRRMQRMIDDLLTLSRVGRHGQPFGPVDLNLLFDAIESNLKRAEGSPAGNLIRATSLPTVPGDASQLLQLFQNLVSNGLKYSDPDKGEVRVAATECDDTWQISVADNGIGIAPEYHQSIFEIFKRLHGYGEYAGTGIGLALCKKIVDRHGGKVWVESRLGDGSRFYVALPKQHCQPPQTSDPPPT